MPHRERATSPGKSADHPFGYYEPPVHCHVVWVDKGFFEKVKSSPAKLPIWFALTAFRAKEVHRIVVAADEFTTPDRDLCSINSYEEQPNYAPSSL